VLGRVVQSLAKALMVSMVVIGAFGTFMLLPAQEAPEFLIRAKHFEEAYFSEYPENRFGRSPRGELLLKRYFFRDLRKAQMGPEGLRFYREAEECLKHEGIETRDYAPYHQIQWHLFAEGWSFVGSRASEFKGAWFIDSIVLKDDLAGQDLEQTIRHELIHLMVGPTQHPMMPDEVGHCLPALMLDEREVQDAGFTRSSRAFPFGFSTVRGERVGPRSKFRHEQLGGTGVPLGPRRSP